MLQRASPWLGVAEALPLAIKNSGGRTPGDVDLMPHRARQAHMYLPPSKVTTSLHWHCSSFTTSLNFVWEICTGICNRCVFWICGERCICCCGSVEPLTGLPPPWLLRPPPRLVWKPGWTTVSLLYHLRPLGAAPLLGEGRRLDLRVKRSTINDMGL